MNLPPSRILLRGVDPLALRPCADLLSGMGLQVRVLEPSSALQDPLLHFKPHLILAEIPEPGWDWRGLLEEVRQSRQRIPVILIATRETLDEAIEAIKEGVEDFVLQPCDPQTVFMRIKKALEARQLQEELQTLQSELRFRRNEDYIVTVSPKMRFVLDQIHKVASTDLGVLITGETGTGKELVARAIHYNGRRAGHPFLVINCSAIPEPLLENQLFGHVRGSYTGADSTVAGLFETAHGGTVFLDEIGDLPLPLQAKLLRVLEKGGFRKIGGSEEIHVDVRILAATHKDLKIEIGQERFREDLYYRLSAFPIRIPPLRERKEDIPALVNHFFRLYQKQLNKKLEGFSISAIQKLMFHDWPGNVRELENRVRQAMINASGPLVYREDIDLEDPKRATPFKSFKEAKHEFEKNYILNVLRIAQGNVAQAARLAQKDRKDFYDVMRKYKIRSQDFRSS